MNVTAVDIMTLTSRFVCGGQACLLILVTRQHMWQDEDAFRHCVSAPQHFFVLFSCFVSPSAAQLLLQGPLLD